VVNVYYSIVFPRAHFSQLLNATTIAFIVRFLLRISTEPKIRSLEEGRAVGMLCIIEMGFLLRDGGGAKLGLCLGSLCLDGLLGAGWAAARLLGSPLDAEIAGWRRCQIEVQWLQNRLLLTLVHFLLSLLLLLLHNYFDDRSRFHRWFQIFGRCLVRLLILFCR
ncbi:hypothetical protein PFISCL1PPCAC_17344, partial [Pristionchus fissidentatus]